MGATQSETAASAWLQIAAEEAARAARESPWLNNCLCVTKHGPDTCAWLQVAVEQATWAAPESPWLNNCLCVTKHGPDTCAWLQVAAKQAALAALDTQLGSTNTSASQNTKPLAQQLPVLQDRGQILVLGCRLLPSKLP